jgi:hypothetical protein
LSVTPGATNAGRDTARRIQYANATKGIYQDRIGTTVLVAMKAFLILASLLTLAPMVRADEVIVRHEPTVVVHEHYHHHYRHYHHDVVVVHPN